MNRRKFLSAGAAAALTASLRAQPPQPGARPLKIDAYSRHLQWLRTAGEVAAAAKEMGYDGVDITVRPKPGHVDPTRVAQDLPPFVKTIRENGLQVSTITCPITDADSPNAEEILKTASELDIRHYWWGTFRYNYSKPIVEQLDALKPRVAKLAALNAKYRMTAMYHTYSGNAIGASIFDFLYVLKDFDPAQVGLHYDIGHMTNAGGNGTWVTGLRAAGPYVAGVSVKDSYIEKTPNGDWRVRYVPLGQGNVRLDQFASILKEINFAGPIEIQAEYPNGGAENAMDHLTLPRDQVLGAMKKDQEILRAALRKAGLV
ncbi:MAG: sugar phosphate isomerase/epimerase [Acidobacteriia bacterium]|nr:sugar phosphate isomerase/epimerase [Terriglobia bacterium]